MTRRKIDIAKIRAEKAAHPLEARFWGPHLPQKEPPPFHSYVFDKPYPERLIFRDVEVALEIVTRPGLHRAWWILQARKLTPDGAAIDLVSEDYGRDHLEVPIFRTGFSHQEGTPGARVMDCLVRLGYAHVLLPRGYPQGLAHGRETSRA